MHNLTGWVLLPLVAFPLLAPAAEWSIEPKISLRAGRDDNIRLTAAAHSPVWETTLSPSAKFGVATETSGLTGDAMMAIRRYTGGTGRERGSVLNREDYHLGTTAYHNTEADNLKATLDFTRDSTLDSELDETGQVTDNRVTRQKLALGPSWSRLLTELTRLELSYQFNDVNYKNDPGRNDQIDYRYHVANASLIRQLTPRVYGTLTAGYSNYQPETNFDSVTVSLQAGLTTNFTETLQASFLAGQRKTTSDTVPSVSASGKFDSTSAIYTASITKTLETGSLSASVSRYSYPSSLGELLDSTRLALKGDHKLTETLRTSLRVEYVENETIVSRGVTVPSQDKETFLRISPKASWRWSRTWELEGEYRYVDNDDPVSGTATRNSVYVTLTYKPPKTSLAR
ncbi:MAG: hypothetical protein R3F42_14660 [Pseudomonadota bacterium]